MPKSEPSKPSIAGPTAPDALEDDRLEVAARTFLRETVGIREETRRSWECFSCLLSQVYDLFCRAGPEGDVQFFKDVEQTKFERVTATQTDTSAAAHDSVPKASFV